MLAGFLCFLPLCSFDTLLAAQYAPRRIVVSPQVLSSNLRGFLSWKKALWASCLSAGILLAPATLKAQGNYLDVYIAKVKPEKAIETEAIAKKITDANRHNDGDRVLVEQPVYGDLYTYVFVTQRDGYADVDKGNDAFLASLNKAFGKEGAMKVFADWNNCLVHLGVGTLL